MSNPHRGPELRGRRSECQSLERLLEDVRGGQSRVLVLRGDAGVGKTALLDYLTVSASGCRIARAAGVESEVELAFAGLHQLCAPLLSHLAHLPAHDHGGVPAWQLRPRPPGFLVLLLKKQGAPVLVPAQ